jgi:cell division protein FtsB
MLKKLNFFIIICVLAVLFFPGFAKFQELKQKLSDTEAKLRQTQKRNAFLEERIGQLKTNQDSLEIVAREKMGVVKKGETVLKLIREDAPLDK